MEQGPVYQKYIYKKYEKGLMRPDGMPGFNTPTGRIEFYSTLFQAYGYDPLPYILLVEGLPQVYANFNP